MPEARQDPSLAVLLGLLTVLSSGAAQPRLQHQQDAGEDAHGGLLWSGALQSHSSFSHQPVLAAASHDTGDTQQDWDVVTGLTESRSPFH